MNWITDVLPPKIRSFLKRDTPENLWIKCPETGQMVFHKDLESNLYVIPGSGVHMRMGSTARLKSIFDNGTWIDVALPDVPIDPLKFRDEKRYVDRLKDARARTGMADAIKVGYGKLDGMAVTVAVQDMDFMAGSLGTAAGEAIIKGMMTAVEKRTPFIIFTASGGARMQEGIFSLMQMGKTCAAINRFREIRQPYISVMLHPTTGGVAASFSWLGDVILAEPRALIGFAGPRVIEQTIRQKLPEGFQRSEFLLQHGFLDAVVKRAEMKAYLSTALRFLAG